MPDDILRPIVSGLEEYKPGKNPDKPGMIKLASNENPFGPSPMALKAIEKAAGNLQTYPDQKAASLREALSKKLGVPESGIICGNGSDDIMQIACSTFLSPGEEVVIPKNSFSVYGLVTKIFGGKETYVELNDHREDLEKIAAAVTDNAKMIFLTNPHNPCGTIFTASELESFVGKVPEKTLIVIDEAYAEFAESKEFPDSIGLVKKGRRNILVLRTFSKFYGLAGLRAGYGIAAPELISAMMKTKMPFNVSRLAQAGAAAALNDKEFLDKTYKNNSDGKKQLYAGLDKLGLSYNKAEANFIFVGLKKSADEVFVSMLADGVIIRPLTSFGFPEAIRVSIGTKEQNEKFLAALAKAL